MTDRPIKDLQKTIDDFLSQPRTEAEGDEEYQSGFGSEGPRKAEYIVDDLRYRERAGSLRIADLGYLSIGGADGSEISFVLRTTDITKGVIVEYSDWGADHARNYAKQLKDSGKELIVIHGDAMGRLDDALSHIEGWLNAGKINGLVCSAQAVLHELPRRSPTFYLPEFLGKLFRDSRWNARLFYSREPARPEGWTEKVHIAIPGVSGEALAEFANCTKRFLSMEGSPVAVAGNWVLLPSMLAVETLHKLIRGSTLRRIRYELGEQLTEFDPIEVKQQLEAVVDGMHVSVERITTLGFKRALEEHSVRYMGSRTEALPIPSTHAEIVGFARVSDPLARMPETFEHPEDLGTAARPKTLDHVEVERLFCGDLRPQDVDAWLAQFEIGERPYIAALLRAFRYYGKRRIYDLCQRLYRLVMTRLGLDDPSLLRFVQFGGAARSGAVIARQFRIANGLDIRYFMETSELRQDEDAKNLPVVFLDDILASGRQASVMWQRMIEDGTLKMTSRPLLATLAGTAEGIRFVEERTAFQTCTAELVDDANIQLGPLSEVFGDANSREIAKAIVETYGRRLLPDAPFGYLGGGMLVSFDHGTPDNSLPIFWVERPDWKPLLRAGGSDRLSAQTGHPD